MHVVLATDIFGESDWTLKLKRVFSDQGYQVSLVTPYEQRHTLQSEADAYALFTQYGGFDNYCEKIQQVVSAQLDIPCLYLGFSAGAAGLWRVLADQVVSNQSHLLAFYPGQIRHHLDLTPSVATSIVFPKQEQHFDLSKVIEYLVTKPKLNLIQNKLQHGYANPSSDNYNKEASDELMRLLSTSKCLLEPAQLITEVLKLNEQHKVIQQGQLWD